MAFSSRSLRQPKYNTDLKTAENLWFSFGVGRCFLRLETIIHPFQERRKITIFQPMGVEKTTAKALAFLPDTG